MKNTRLILSAILTAVMIFTLCASVFADGSPMIEMGKYNAVPGKTVSVTVSLKNNPGITYLRVTAEVDNSAFALTGVENGTLFPTLDEGINLVWSADSEVKEDGVLCTLVFTVSEDAGTDSVANVRFTVRECYNDRYEDVTVTVEDGLIAVGCDHEETTVTVVTSPSCTAEGYNKSVCNSCGHEETVTVPAVGHTLGHWVTTRAPEVGVDGEMSEICSVCDTVITTQVIPALSEGQGGTLAPAAPSGCGGGGSTSPTAAIGGLLTTLIPALAVLLTKRFFF